MRFRLAAVLSVLLVALMAASASAVNVGDRAPSFEGEGLGGEKVDLKDYLGKKTILLKFGSIYCSTCVSSLEDIARIQRKFRPEDLQVVGVNLDVYGLARVRRFYGGYAGLIRYPLVIDEKLAVSRPYDIRSIPAHVVIDRDGIVRFASTGTSERDVMTLEDVLARVIRGKEGVEKLAKELPLQVFLPLNFTKTLQDSIYVVGKTRPGSKVFLTLNGGSRQVVRAMRDMFYIRTPLSLGSNYIELQVMGDLGDRVTQGIVLFREPKIGMGISSPFPEYHFHTEKNEAPCRKCHDLNPPAESAQGFATATRFCLGCHKELTGQKVVHGPIPIGGCAPCHRFSSKPNRYEPIALGQDLCFKCHEEKRKDLIRTYLHGPMSAGLCTICHSPHGSSEKYQLRRYVGDLCVMCHEGIKSASFRETVHKPFGDGACTKCHEPHSSNRNDGFLKRPGNDLCLGCHTGLTRMSHTHPWGVPPKRERMIKLDKDGNLMCLSCHEAHASDEPKLLVKGGCDRCHAS
ncbi:MAG: redoxin domain-containing protein [Deltaproteobacteria bacterium]|nr:redoxin domain-containing protein [Deltaproteobacteria bacterium]